MPHADSFIYHLVLSSEPDLFPAEFKRIDPHRKLVVSILPPLNFTYFGLSQSWLEERFLFEFLRAYFQFQTWPSEKWIRNILIFPPYGTEELPEWLLLGIAASPELFMEQSSFQHPALSDFILRRAFIQKTLESSHNDTLVGLSHLYSKEALEQLPIYLGRRFLSFLESHYGQKPIVEFFKRQSSGVTYFSMMAVFREQFNADLEDLWNKFLNDVRTSYLKKEEIFTRQKKIPWNFLNISTPSFHPRLSQDGTEVLHTHWEKPGQSSLRIVDLETQEVRWKHTRATVFDGSWFPGGKKIVFSDYSRWGLLDLYVYDRELDEISPLTKDLNAHSPEVSGDGEWILFIHRSEERENLAIMDKLGERWVDLTEIPQGGRILSPRWSWDGSQASFVHLDVQGKFTLYLYDFNEGEIKRVFTKSDPVLFPYAISATRVLYVTPEEGSFNLYLWNHGKKTNRLILKQSEGIFDFDISHNVFLGNLYGPAGFQTAVTAVKNLSLSLKIPEKVTLDIGIPPQEPPKTEPKKENEKEAKDKKKEEPWGSYTVWETLFPVTLAPWLRTVERGALIGAYAGAEDLFGKHRLSGIFAWDSRAVGSFDSGPYFKGEYWNGQLPVHFILRGENEHTFITTKKRMHRRIEGEILLSRPFDVLDGELAIYGGWGVRKVVVKNKGTAIRFQQTYTIPKIGWQYDNRVKNKSDFSYRQGRYLSFYSEFALNQVLEDEFHYTLSGKWKEYFSMDWPLESVLALNVAWATTQKAFHLVKFYQVGGELGYVFTPQEYLLRGYDHNEFLDHNPLIINTEYRFLMAPLFTGLMTPPLFLKSLYGVWITDVGTERASRGYKVGIGAEMRLDMTWLRDYEVTLRGGVHQGLSRLGKTVGFIGVSQLF